MAEKIIKTYSDSLKKYNGEAVLKNFRAKGHRLLALEQTVTDESGDGSDKRLEKRKNTSYELCLITQGSQGYVIGDEQVRVNEGEFILISPEVEYSLSFEKGGCSKYRIQMNFPSWYPFDTDTFNNKMQKNKYLVGDASQESVTPIEYLFSYYESSSPIIVEVMNSCIHLFLMAIAEDIVEELRILEKESVLANDRSYRTSNFCNKLMSYIYDNMSQTLTIDDVAKHFSMSSRQINRKLQQFYKMSFKDVNAKIKCDYAKQLLQYYDYNLDEITEKIGYSYKCSFIRLFKRIEGQTPNEYRKKYLESQNMKEE